MPEFSEHSSQRLRTCDARLQDLFNEVIAGYDCTILEGFRSEDRQQELFAAGRSQLHFPHSHHNREPARAVDVAPWPLDWGTEGTREQREKARARFYHFAGYVQAVADAQGVGIRWGGDWDSDKAFDDQSFDDLAHFELLDGD